MSFIVFDCEGVLRPTKGLSKVVLEYLKKYFKIRIPEAEIAKNVSIFSGGTFHGAYFKALEFFVPGYDQEKAEQCYRELLKKRATIYKEVEAFPEVIDTLEKLSKSHYLAISTGLEKIYIEEWLKRTNIIHLFKEIYSGDDGTKEKHIQMIRQKYPEERIVYVGDAISEMKLGVPAIGVARNSSQEQLLWIAGAKAVVSSLNEILDIDLDLL